METTVKEILIFYGIFLVTGVIFYGAERMIPVHQKEYLQIPAVYTAVLLLAWFGVIDTILSIQLMSGFLLLAIFLAWWAWEKKEN
jgi:hypothetical protein